MNIKLTLSADPAHVTALRQDNDRFRQGQVEGTLSLSAGIIGLGAAAQARIIDAVRAFDDFDDGDPTDIHDLGDFEIPVCSPAKTGAEPLAKPALIFFRIDQASTSCHSRVLTLMLASEW